MWNVNKEYFEWRELISTNGREYVVTVLLEFKEEFIKGATCK